MRLVHWRMHKLTVTRLTAHHEPVILMPLEGVNHGHACAALLDAKSGARLSLIAVHADGIDAHVHHRHVDTPVVTHVVLDGLANQIRVAA